jgi:2-amino-4-hydroxy-6-hydroxymethyldihydropteridine diphosphokinase
MIFYIGLGSNLGNRKKHLELALTLLEKKGVSIIRISSLYETAPAGLRKQPVFLNMAAAAESNLYPDILLKTLKSIERRIGRKPSPPNHPRCIDLDILLAGNQVLSRPALIIPHPRMHERRFVLVPLAEISPNAFHPVLGLSVKRLLEHCPDTGFVRKSGTLDFSAP